MITWQKVSFATADVGEMDQFVTVAVECTPIYDATYGIITAVAKCNVDGRGLRTMGIFAWPLRPKQTWI